MKRQKEFEAQQREISEQVQVVLEARLQLKEAADAHAIARSEEVRCSNNKNNAAKKLEQEQAKLDALLKQPPTP